MAAWAVPTTVRFYKPLGIWFLGSIKYLAGKKKTWKSAGKYQRKTLSFTVFYQLLTVPFLEF